MKFGARGVQILWQWGVRIVTLGARTGALTTWSALTTLWLMNVCAAEFLARTGPLTIWSAVKTAWLTGVPAVNTFVRTSALTTSSAFKTAWLMGMRKVKRFARTSASTVWSLLTAMWMMDVRRVKFIAKIFANVCVGLAVLCMHFPGGEASPLDWFMFALGVFGTSITFLVLRDLEQHLETPTFVRFLAANCSGAAMAACVEQCSGFDWDDSDMRVLGFGGAALWMVGVHNLNLYLALSETVVNPFGRLAAAVAAAITTTAAEAVHYDHRLLGQANPDLVALQSGILIYGLVSTWPLLVRFVKRVMVPTMRQLNKVSIRVCRVMWVR